jgi:rod shape-determining protein MreD
MRTAFYYLLGLIVLYLQVLLTPSMTLWHWLPSFLLGFVIYTSTRMSLNASVILAFIMGLGVDLLYPMTLGLQAFALLTVAFAVNRLNPHLNKEKPVNTLLGIFAANLLFLLLFTLYHILAYPAGMELWLVIPVSLALNIILSTLEIVLLDILDRLRLVMHE